MKRIAFVFMGLLAIAGLVCVGIRFAGGMKVTHLTSSIPWGMWVVFYIYFVGLSAGMYMVSTLAYVFGFKWVERIGPLAILCALVALFTGLFFIWIDLGHPFRFWRVIVNFNYTSVLAWEVVLYSIYLVLLLVSFFYLRRCDLADRAERAAGLKRRLAAILSLGFRCPESRERYEECHGHSLRVVRLLGFAGIPLVLLVRGGTGALFAVVVARPHWFSGLLPIVFLVSSLLSAVAMLLFIQYLLYGREETREQLAVAHYLRNLLLFLLSVEWLLFMSETLVGLYSKIPERLELYQKIMFGPFPYIFWGGQLFLGLLAPVFLCTYRRTRRSPFWLSAAGISCSCGVVSVILNLIVPAYVLPMLKGLDRAFIDPRLSYYYFPSIVEWISSFGLICLAALAFLFLLETLPILPEVEDRFRKVRT